MERREKTVFGRSAGRITAVFKDLWLGENRNKAKKEQPVNKNDVAKFDAVLDAIHEKQNSYKAGMKADGKLEKVIEDRNKAAAGRTSNQIKRDRAD